MKNIFLEAWEENFKKGQLSFWIFTALKEDSKDAKQIVEFVRDINESNSSYDQQSVYRSLRKLNTIGFIDFKTEPSPNGPDLKKYFLTDQGKELFAKFIERNIQVFYKDKLINILNK